MKKRLFSVFKYLRFPDEERLKYAVYVQSHGLFVLQYAGKSNSYTKLKVIDHQPDVKNRAFIKDCGFVLFQSQNESEIRLAKEVVLSYLDKKDELELEHILLSLPKMGVFHDVKNDQHFVIEKSFLIESYARCVKQYPATTLDWLMDELSPKYIWELMQDPNIKKSFSDDILEKMPDINYKKGA